MSTGILLLLDNNGVRRERTAFALDSQGDWSVQPVSSCDEARGWLTHPELAGIICDQGDASESGVAFLRELRLEPRTAALAFVLVTPPTSSGVRVEGWAAGADAVVMHPLHPGELLSCFAACVNRRGSPSAGVAAQRELEQSAERIQRTLVTLLDAVLPGAAFRGEEIAALGLQLAHEFEIPLDMRADLERAARLHELGRMVAERIPGPDEAGGLDAVSPAVLAASAVLLEPLPGMKTVADLIGGIGANWDGSGRPSRLERGEIPLRSRILRVATDYVWALQDADGSGVPQQACDKLGLHNGTLYDPAVLSALALLVSLGDPLSASQLMQPVRVDRLTEGLMLVDDLRTASGVKLLSAGAILTAASLRLISERHASDPIVHAVATRRRDR